MKTGLEINNYNGALQKHLGSGFNAKTTASEVIKGIDLAGKIAIVTGGNTGIGLETTKVLAAAGAIVVVPARDIQKAKTNLRGVANVELEPMDLTDPKSVDAFAERFLSTRRPLHLLINNAGIMWVPLRRDSRGIEFQRPITSDSFNSRQDCGPHSKRQMARESCSFEIYIHHLVEHCLTVCVERIARDSFKLTSYW